jgi:hypothetical protein
MQRLDKSVPLFEAALQQNERAFGPKHPNTIKIAANLGVNYAGAGRLSEGLPLLEMAYQASKERPGSEWIGGELLFTSIKAADPAKPGDVLKIATLVKELIANARKALPEDSPQLAGQLAQFGLMLLEVQAWNEAEPLIRESLTIREKIQPEVWTTFNAKSLLGAALLGQQQYAEAEPLLLAGYRGMRDREASIPPQGETRIPEALERLVQLYEATGDASQAEEWRGLLTLAQPAPIKNP